jgi:diacylglycerol kinase family enzyme
VAASDTLTRRAEALAESVLLEPRPRKRMLVIVNPYATTVSERLKNLVVYALRGRYDVQAVETEARDHATELCREAARDQYDVVVAFGGDGTLNEAANGLVGSETPLTCLPGGATNVFCRTIGIPTDVVDATEHLLRMADAFEPRRIDVGRVNQRHFIFASGAGLDASVVERVDSHPKLKARAGEWYFTYAAFSTFTRRYLLNPPHVRVEAAGREVDGVTVVVQNSDPFTYFGRRPIRLCPDAGLESGSLSAAVLTRASPLDIPTVVARVFSGRAGTVTRHRRIDGLGAVSEMRVSSRDGEPFPLQVDGDYVGEFDEVSYGVSPAGLAIVA